MDDINQHPRNTRSNEAGQKGAHWGVDADPQNEPTYPMRQRTGEEHQGYNWERPSQQPVDVEVLHSNERPNVTAVFGAANPPSGLSGQLRRQAFKYGEGSYAHWLLLLAADRINMIEGIVDDLRHFRVPDVCAESGMKAQWRYDRKTVYKKAAVAGVVAAGAYLLLRKRNSR